MSDTRLMLAFLATGRHLTQKSIVRQSDDDQQGDKGTDGQIILAMKPKRHPVKPLRSLPVHHLHKPKKIQSSIQTRDRVGKSPNEELLVLSFLCGLLLIMGVAVAAELFLPLATSTLAKVLLSTVSVYVMAYAAAAVCMLKLFPAWDQQRNCTEEEELQKKSVYSQSPPCYLPSQQLQLEVTPSNNAEKVIPAELAKQYNYEPLDPNRFSLDKL